MNVFLGKQKRFENESDRAHKKQRDEQNEEPSSTTLYDLPLEMLDIILQKSYLHWIMKSTTKQRDEEVIRSLISVDVCFNRKITRQRFKRAVLLYFKDFYVKIKTISAIIRNNRNYLLENIQPNDELIASLVSLNCITEEQSHFIQRQRSTRDKNDELLYVVESFDEIKLSNFVKCLRQTNQKTVARVTENGGVVIKIEVQTRGEKCTKSVETQLLHKKVEDLQGRTKQRSHQIDIIISQLKDEGIEILDSQLDRHTVVVWIWCRSQSAFEHIQRLYESNQLRDVFFDNIQPSISKGINIDINQFKKTNAVFPISISFTQRIQIQRKEFVVGVTKLRDKIYVLCGLFHYSHVVRVFEDRNRFRPQKNIKLNQIKNPKDIGSSEKENCLYVSDGEGKCIWKITRETNDEYKIIKWLATEYQLSALSVSSDGQLLLVIESSSMLMIYGSDAELVRSIQLPREIRNPIHAVETCIGNFIILHMWRKEKGESWSSWKGMVMKWGICELTRDGQMVIRCFIPSNVTQTLNDPRYILLDSDDRVFVADTGYHGRVIVLDFDLKWNRNLCSVKVVQMIRQPQCLYYDEEKKQLFVGGGGGLGHVNVYTLSRR